MMAKIEASMKAPLQSDPVNLDRMNGTIVPRGIQIPNAIQISDMSVVLAPFTVGATVRQQTAERLEQPGYLSGLVRFDRRAGWRSAQSRHCSNLAE